MTGVIVIIYLAVVVFEIAALWKVFTKAGEPGWQAIIPIWNTIVLLKIIGRPAWWFILLLIPIVNIVIAIIMVVDLAKVFGKTGAFAVGLFLLSFIFVPILGYGDARYAGPANRPQVGYAA